MNCSNCGADSKDPEVCSTCGVPIMSKKTPAKTPALSSKTRNTSGASKVNGVLTETREEEDLTQSIRKLRIGLYVSFGFSVLLLVFGLVYVSQTQEKIATLESDISDVDSSIANLEFEMDHIKDWGYDEIDSVVSCVNDFIDSWADRQPAFYCLDPMIP